MSLQTKPEDSVWFDLLAKVSYGWIGKGKKYSAYVGDRKLVYIFEERSTKSMCLDVCCKEIAKNKFMSI